jgi:hypothetical protein
MKKLIIALAFLLFAGITYGQSIEKGNLIGLHLVSVDLKPGATIDQYIKFFNENTKPAWENYYAGMKIFMIKGIRGEQANELGFIVHFKNEADRDKFYKSDGSLSELGEKVSEKIVPANEALEKIGTWTSTYTDWIVQ